MIKDAKFEVDDHIRISKYKNIFAKVYDPNWSEEVFVIKKVTKYRAMNTCNDRNGDKSNERKGDKLYVKWEGYDKSCNGSIDRKISLYKMGYFAEPYIRFRFCLSKYARKSDFCQKIGTL